MVRRFIERVFEDAIEQHLLDAGGYVPVDRDGFDPDRAIFPAEVIRYLRITQPADWKYIAAIHKKQAEAVLLDDLVRALESEYEGCLSVLRNGFKCSGRRLYPARFAPASGRNPETIRQYEANRLSIVRQLRYSIRHGNIIDVVIALNGIPIVTMELKNPLSGQTWQDAVRQYCRDRDPGDAILRPGRGALVHFALDTDEVHMATNLGGDKTRFLPFNRGHGTGAGNPDNPEGFKTAYLWENVLVRDSLLDIIARFLHRQVDEAQENGKTIRRERLIFPRYHQLDCVRRLVADAAKNGVGKNYLIQHSAGSGKSNSIAWLAHRLSSLHDKRDRKIFDSVVVVTDRLVLDRQLQDTIGQFEHTPGVVKKIDGDSSALAAALVERTPIIVTTLQKFPFVTEKIGELPKRRYAVIVDEAHSSQSGETAAELRGVLGATAMREEAKAIAEGDELDDYQEEILKAMAKRGRQANMSFFAFTATPKYKTLEVFGQHDKDGKPQPFHLYSMRQAIEEGFILDVLRNYTTYKTYYRLAKAIRDNPALEKRKAVRALSRFASLHPHNISQKTQLVIEHFRQNIRHKIGGRAKAMLVTSSRLHAVRYKLAFDRYLSEKGYSDVKTLVAFSGVVSDPKTPGVEYTESGMNLDVKGRRIGEKELPERFAGSEYQVLLVADKYQTGFDQPLLHTLYVDKRLSGIQAVQTLSRLNRVYPGKEDTFVLDFVNDPEEILASFQPYYEQTLVGEQADPCQLHELQGKLFGEGVFFKAEIEEFARIFYRPKRNQTATDLAKITRIIDPAVGRFSALPEERRDEFKKTLAAFQNLYAFLTQIVPYGDQEMERLYSFTRHLAAKLPAEDRTAPYQFDNEIALKYYRLQKISEGGIALSPGKNEPVSGPLAVGTGKERENPIELSRLIDLLNERFGTEFTSGDQLFFDSIMEDALSDDVIRQAAQANTIDNFGFVFHKALEGFFIDRMEQNENLTAQFLNERRFREAVSQYMIHDIYKRIRTKKVSDTPDRAKNL